MQCYAVHLGNCGGGVSREHYVSKSVLEIAGKVLQISGFPWQEANKPMQIGINSLTSKTLCEYHNSQLSSLDNSGRAFLQTLKSTFDDAIGGNFTDQVVDLEGDKIELWLLKTLCSVLTATNAAKVPEVWVNALFGLEPFPDNHGLYIFGQPGIGAAWYFNLVRIIGVPDKGGGLAGAKFGIGGLALLLAFGKPTFWESGFFSIHRPERINIKRGAETKTLQLSWGCHTGRGHVDLDIMGHLESQNPEYNPVVSPEFDANF
jgi:hypothetical protein